MIKNRILAALTALLLSPSALFAAGGDGYVEDYSFSFDGPFGTYDEDQLRRGFQVYTEICSACHGLQYVPIRTLADEGGPNFSEEEVRAYVDTMFIADYGSNLHLYDNDLGDLRPLTPNDNFPVNNAAGAPDLSLMAKARARGGAGADYIASLLTHYTGEDQDVAGSFLYGNETYSGGYLSMSQPLWGDDVVYQDGTPATLEQEAMDVAAFLMWTAEPHMMARKRLGLVAILILGLFAGLLYFTNKELWAPIKGKGKGDGHT